MNNLRKSTQRARYIYYFLFGIIFTLGGIGYKSITDTAGKFNQYEVIAKDSNLIKNLLSDLLFLRLTTKNYVQYDSQENIDKFLAQQNKTEVNIDKSIAARTDKEKIQKLTKMKMQFENYKESFLKLVDVRSKQRELKKNLSEIHSDDINLLNSIQNTLDRATLKSLYWELYANVNMNLLQGKEISGKEFEPLKRALISVGVNKAQESKRLLIDNLNNVISKIQVIQQNEKKASSIIEEELDKIGPEIATFLNKISDDIEEKQENVGSSIVSDNEKAQDLVLWTSLLSLFIAGVSVAFVMRSLKGIFLSILGLSDKLNQNINNVSTISDKTATSSRTVADSSLSQASSIEESSNSLEELEGMTARNLDSVKSSNELTQNMKRVAEEANEAIDELVDSMGQITESNNRIEDLTNVIAEIERKTKLIDEIVSQTKVLSFNASVEAERAGEHGKGFAVVAEEVGNLAKTSGQAAKEIQEILISSLKTVDQIVSTNKDKVERGSSITSKTHKILKEINQACSSVLGKNQEVLNASNEQAVGIKQINIAISNLDKTTQQNSTVAKDSSDVALELQGQAKELDRIVNSLNSLIGHSGGPKAEDQKGQNNDYSGERDSKDSHANVLALVQKQVEGEKSVSVSQESSSEHPQQTIEANQKVVNDPWDSL